MVSVNTAHTEMDANGARFLQIVALTHDDDDTNSHMSGIPLQHPASAKLSVEQICIGHVFTSWKRPPCNMFTVPTDTLK